ncbi:hypothetical protein DPMN_127177 [Dreissena polymorpha]|uniref:Uncharacterized protein n=1 Tax=Dreissena polymorpha TaxID=45954 RepID=A0A9D4JYX0_DREPO|nr:hypothetical protein DPMN_127177 [Dreissena polymorpha]
MQYYLYLRPLRRRLQRRNEDDGPWTKTHRDQRSDGWFFICASGSGACTASTLAMCAFMISCDIKPFVPKFQPYERLMGVLLLPSLHSYLVNDSHFRERIKCLQDNGEVLFHMFQEDNMDVEEDEMPYGSLGVSGTDPDVCREKFLALCNELGIESDTYKVSNFVHYFRY